MVRPASNATLQEARDMISTVHTAFNLAPPAMEANQEPNQQTQFVHHEDMLDYYYFHPDHLGSSSYITNVVGAVSQHMEYLPFGETLVDEHTNSYNSPFKFNGKELDNETGNYYYSARYYDPKLSIFISVDPLAEKYPGISPYAYCFNNPVIYVDPDGRDVILVIWASHNGKIGHAGIAVSNYKEVTTQVKEGGKWVTKTEMVPDGTYTYRDLWPGGEGAGKSNFNEDIQGVYNKGVFTLDQLQNTDVTGAEGYVPDAVIQLTTDFKTDELVNMALDAHQKYNPDYNGLTNNCTDFVEAGAFYAGDNTINANEKLTDRTSAATPNQLYKSTSGQPNANVLKDPGQKVNQGFIEAVSGGGVKQKAAERMVD